MEILKNKNIYVFNTVAKDYLSRLKAYKKLKSYGFKF